MRTSTLSASMATVTSTTSRSGPNMGLGAEAQAAIRVARKTFTKGGIESLRLAPAATGDLCDLVRLPGRYGQRIASIAGSAEIWESVTPFVPPRYIKANGRNTLEGQIRAELRSRGLPEPAKIQLIGPSSKGWALPRQLPERRAWPGGVSAILSCRADAGRTHR